MRLSIQVQSICVHLIVLYRVPPSKKNGLAISDFITQFTEYLDSLFTLKGKLIIAGDFNIHWDKSNDSSSDRRDLDVLLDTYSFKQHVTEATHVKGHTIDLIISRSNDDCIKSTVVDDLISDHYAVNCDLQCVKLPPLKKTVQYRKLKSLVPEILKEKVAESSICTSSSNNLNDLVNQYHNDLRNILDSEAPMQTKTFIERPLIPWINNDILNSKKRKRKLEKQWRKSKLTIHQQMFLSEKLHYQQLIKDAKTSHYRNEINQCSGDQGRLFKIISHLQNVKNKPTLPDYDSLQQLCNTFNEFFITKIFDIRSKLDNIPLANTTDPVTTTDLLDPDLSINCFAGVTLTKFSPVSSDELIRMIKDTSNATCELDPIPTKLVKSVLLETLLPSVIKIINLSLESGIFPDLYKQANVKPLLKKISLDPNCLKNYRPVSNLNFLSKLVEKVVAHQLVSHLQQFNLLETFQSAYKPYHSTETALVRVSNDILRAIDNKQCVLLTLLDLSAAFDTIDHSILLHILRNDLGIDDKALQWFESYLSNRTQCVIIDGVKSQPQKLLYGVPQGSVLGPILFTVYMTALGKIMKQHNFSFHAYADDTQIYIAFKSNDTYDTISKLELCLAEIRQWMIKHKLKLNDNKTELIVISSPYMSKELNTIKVSIGNEMVTCSRNVRNLGFIMDSTFKMDAHITSICQTCYYHLRNIGAIRCYLDTDTAAQLIHAFVTSKLDYCNSILFGLSNKSLSRLKKIQNTAVRIITMCNIRSNITPHLKSLHWLPVHLRIHYKIILLTFKTLNGLAPSYLFDILTLHNSSYNTRSASSNLLVIPRTRTAYGDRAFSVAAPTLWNALPEDIRVETKLTSFKTKLKTYLFAKF